MPQRPLRIAAVILAFILASGCESRTDKQLNSLYREATSYLEAGDLENAADVFNEMLEIKNDPQIREKLDRTLADKIELELTKLDEQAVKQLEEGNFAAAEATVEEMLALKETPEAKQRLQEIKRDRKALITINALYGEWEKVREDISSAASGAAIMRLLAPAQAIVADLEAIDLSGNSEATRYIRALLDNPLYQLYKSDYLSGKTIVTEFEDSITISSKKFRVSAVVDGLLEAQPPAPPNG